MCRCVVKAKRIAHKNACFKFVSVFFSFKQIDVNYFANTLLPKVTLLCHAINSFAISQDLLNEFVSAVHIALHPQWKPTDG